MKNAVKIFLLLVITSLAVIVEYGLTQSGHGSISCSYGSGYDYGCAPTSYQGLLAVAVIYIIVSIYILKR